MNVLIVARTHQSPESECMVKQLDSSLCQAIIAYASGKWKHAHSKRMRKYAERSFLEDDPVEMIKALTSVTMDMVKGFLAEINLNPMASMIPMRFDLKRHYHVDLNCSFVGPDLFVRKYGERVHKYCYGIRIGLEFVYVGRSGRHAPSIRDVKRIFVKWLRNEQFRYGSCPKFHAFDYGLLLKSSNIGIDIHSVALVKKHTVHQHHHHHHDKEEEKEEGDNDDDNDNTDDSNNTDDKDDDDSDDDSGDDE